MSRERHQFCVGEECKGITPFKNINVKALHEVKESV